MAELLPKDKKAGIWTAEKVEYAWYHGVSDRCQLTLGPLHWSGELSENVNKVKMTRYYLEEMNF